MRHNNNTKFPQLTTFQYSMPGAGALHRRRYAGFQSFALSTLVQVVTERHRSQEACFSGEFKFCYVLMTNFIYKDMIQDVAPVLKRSARTVSLPVILTPLVMSCQNCESISGSSNNV
jgi:hypothetical protein